MLVATTAFEKLARRHAGYRGLPEPRMIVVDHPLGGLLPDEVVRRAAGATERLMKLVAG